MAKWTIFAADHERLRDGSSHFVEVELMPRRDRSVANGKADRATGRALVDPGAAQYRDCELDAIDALAAQTKPLIGPDRSTCARPM